MENHIPKDRLFEILLIAADSHSKKSHLDRTGQSKSEE